MENEGMTDKQFKAFLRLLVGNTENAKVKTDKLINTLQRCIEM